MSAIFLLCSYSAICIQLIRRKRSSAVARNSSERNDAALKKILAHSLVVSLAFLICTIPYLVTANLDSPLGNVARILLVCNVWINPIIYFLFAHCKETIRNRSLSSISRIAQRVDTDGCSGTLRRGLHITGSKPKEEQRIEYDSMKAGSSQS